MYLFIKRFQKITITTILFTFFCNAFAAQDQFGLDLIQGTRLRGEPTEATFSIGMQRAAETEFATQSSTEDDISIIAHIYPDAADIGATADVIVVTATPEGLYMQDDQGAFLPWNGKPKNLVSAYEAVELTSEIPLTIFNGKHNSEGLYRYFVGYLKDGDDNLVFNLKAARFTVESPSDSLLWRVSNGSNTLIVGGTVHALRPDDLPFSEDYTEAYNETDLLITEIDPDDLDNLASLATFFRNDSGILLRDSISTQLYERLSTYFSNANLSINLYELIHPNWIATDMEGISRASQGYVSGVDAYFQNLAEEDNKEIIGLESFASQIILIKKLGSDSDESIEEFLGGVLDAIENGESETGINELLDAWVNADINYFETSVAENKVKSLPDHDILLTDRNLAWLPQLENFLLTPEEELVLVGTLHTVGEDSILALLEEKGYSVERY